MKLEDRDLRQRDIIPPDRLAGCQVTVVGVGAIGRQIALQLAAMGVPALELIDPDIVEPVNLACQGFLERDLCKPKVQATAELCRELHHEVHIQELPHRFRRGMEVGDVMFCGVDAIETRRLIWEAIQHRVAFFCDGRMNAEVVRVLTACGTASRDHYPTTLFGAEQAYTGRCTAKSTIFTANIAAGLMIAQFSRWLRRLPVDADVTFNLLTSECWTATPSAV